jgi:4-hydroxy-tetrahydrodipicolinate reductase
MALNIAIIGFGKMGRMIEKIALEREHIIVARLERGWLPDDLNNADVAIEFTEPNSAFSNIQKILKAGIPVVSGTTGWYDKISDLKQESRNAGLVYASNFSLGVNILFELNSKMAELFSHHDQYKPSLKEEHHKEKKDIPSGTAITLAESIVQNSSLNGWAMKGELGKLPIQSIRKKDLHGNHSITYESEIDKVTLSHSAFNRKGFALGAVIAAEKIFGKTGIHKFNSLLF